MFLNTLAESETVGISENPSYTKSGLRNKGADDLFDD